MRGFHGVVETDLGPAFVDGAAAPTERDMAEVRTFQRFLRIAPSPGDEPGWLLRRGAGWLGYVLGEGPPPPEGMDDVPVTAWRLG